MDGRPGGRRRKRRIGIPVGALSSASTISQLVRRVRVLVLVFVLVNMPSTTTTRYRRRRSASHLALTRTSNDELATRQKGEEAVVYSSGGFALTTRILLSFSPSLQPRPPSTFVVSSAKSFFAIRRSCCFALIPINNALLSPWREDNQSTTTTR